MTVPQITNQRADGISGVVDACPVSVFRKTKLGVKVMFPRECIGCGICSAMCNGIKLIN